MKGALTSQTTMVIRSPKRRDATDKFGGKPRRFHPSGLSPPRLVRYPHPLSALRRTKSASGSLAFLSGYPSSFMIPPPLPEPFVGTLYPPVLQLRGRNAHLVHGRGPIMVSKHSKLLSTHGFSSKTWATSSAQLLSLSSSVPEFLIWLNRPLTTNLSESTFDQRLRLARRCRRLAFLITVMVHASGVETPIVRWRLQC